MTSPARYRLGIVGAAVLFSTGGAAIKACELPAVQVAGFRSGVAALALLILIPAARRGMSWGAGLVGVAYAATMVLFVMGNKLTTAANTIFLQSTAPLYVLVLAPLLLRETTRRRDLAFMAAVALGLAMFFARAELAQRTAPDPMTGNLLATLAGVTWAATLLGLRWLERSGRGAAPHRGSGLAAVVAGNALACIAVLPWALPIAEGTTPVDWILVGYLGVFQIGLAYVLLTFGMRRVPALEASLLILVEPTLNPVWTWVLQGEVPSGWGLAGGAIILTATAVRAIATSPRPRGDA